MMIMMNMKKIEIKMKKIEMTKMHLKTKMMIVSEQSGLSIKER